MKTICVLTLLLLFAGATSAVAENAVRTGVVTDEKQGLVMIVVEGREVVRFSVDGLKLSGSIEYGGMITDTGPDQTILPPAMMPPHQGRGYPGQGPGRQRIEPGSRP